MKFIYFLERLLKKKVNAFMKKNREKQAECNAKLYKLKDDASHIKKIQDRL